jgi:DNA-binding Xre family transcriptional regulator
MIKPPIRKRLVKNNVYEFFEGKVLIARAKLIRKKWIVQPEVEGYVSEECDSIDEAAYVVNALADRRTMIQLRKNIEEWLAVRGFTHVDVYHTLKIQKAQYYGFFDEGVVRGPTLKTLRNIAAVLQCTVADLVAGV